MRSKIALAGLAVGVVTALAPLAPASAQCDPDIGIGSGGCANHCQDLGAKYESARQSLATKFGVVLPPVTFYCTQ